MTDPQASKNDTNGVRGPIPSIDPQQYQAWQFAMSVIAELLLMGNSEDQVVYADVRFTDSRSGTICAASKSRN